MDLTNQGPHHGSIAGVPDLAGNWFWPSARCDLRHLSGPNCPKTHPTVEGRSAQVPASRAAF